MKMNIIKINKKEKEFIIVKMETNVVVNWKIRINLKNGEY